MTITSKIVQPRFCRTLSPVGRYEPARPSGARSSTIAGTRASAPIAAAQPSSALPKIAADEDREQRLGQREGGDEERAGHEHEQAEAEAAPEQPVLEPAERPQPLRNRLDAPGWCSSPESLLPSPA